MDKEETRVLLESWIMKHLMIIENHCIILIAIITFNNQINAVFTGKYIHSCFKIKVLIKCKAMLKLEAEWLIECKLMIKWVNKKVLY